MLNSPIVDSTEPAPPDATTLSLPTRAAWAILILATLYLCYFSHLGAIGFVGPDEPRYAWIARDIAESGDWVTPRLYGKPWFEKPPLYYWSAAISFKLLGVSETAARLPSAIAALLATLSLAWLALRLYGAETARWLLLLLPTSVAMIGFSHAASTDMLFSSTLTAAVVTAAVLLRLLPPNASVVVAEHAAPVPGTISTPTVLAALLFGFFLALAVLAKGPAAVVLLGGAVFFWSLFTKRYRDAFRLFHPAAIATFCLTALPWYILCARRNPDFFRIFIIEHNFKRYLTPEFQHIQPFWYYAAVLLIALLPWTALLLWSAVTGAIRLWRTREINHATLLLLCWSAFCLLFFSLSKSKLPGYILPAIPTIALLSVRGVFILAEKKSKSLPIAILLAGFLFAALYAVVGFFTATLRGPNFFAAIAVGQIVAGLSAANLVLGTGIWLSAKGKRIFVAPLVVLPILLVILVADGLVPAFSIGDPSGKTLSAALRSENMSDGELAAAHMRRGLRYSLSFYMHEEVPEWDPAHPHQGLVLVGFERCPLTSPSDFSCDKRPVELGRTGYFLHRIREKPQALVPDGGKAK